MDEPARPCATIRRLRTCIVLWGTGKSLVSVIVAGGFRFAQCHAGDLVCVTHIFQSLSMSKYLFWNLLEEEDDNELWIYV